MNKKIQPRMECAMNEDELLKVAGGTITEDDITEFNMYKCHGCDTTYATPVPYGPGRCPGCGKSNDDQPGLITML